MNHVFKPLDRRADIGKRRRNLPHWEQVGCTYFVTFRTADSLPQSKLDELNAQKDVWLRAHPEPWTSLVWAEYNRLFSERVQAWMDAGCGACVLRRPELSAMVGSALMHFDGERYGLDAFVVMPNHVHAIVMPLPGHGLPAILHSWKSFTANGINRALGQTGAFWMDENFDHAVRSQDQLEHFRRYIQDNPVKAGLKEGEYLLVEGRG